MIGFESDEAILQKLRERLSSMTDNELIQFGRTVSKLSEGPTGISNPFKRQLEEARAEWKRRKVTSRENSGGRYPESLLVLFSLLSLFVVLLLKPTAPAKPKLDISTFSFTSARIKSR
jgi:hypothetical protein